MFKIAVLLCVCTFTATLATSDAFPSETQQKVLDRLQTSADWETIGQVGSKVFLKNNEADSWLAGRSKCLEEGLEFAVFQNLDEFGFIAQNTTAPSGLWISGILRNTETIGDQTAFNWYADGTSVPQEINLRLDGNQWLCLYYSGNRERNTLADSCLAGRHQTLCQMQVE